MNKNTIVCMSHNPLRTIMIMTVISVLIVWGCFGKKPETFRVGIICGTDFFLPIVDGFKAKMVQLGYVEGQNIIYDLYALNDSLEDQQKAAQKLVDAKIDVILTVSTAPTIQAKLAVQGTNIPIVFAYAGVEGYQIIESIHKPGGNITGVRFPGPDQIAKRLEILRELIPSVQKVWVGYNKNYPNSIPALSALRQLASSYGVTLIEASLENIEDLKLELASLEDRDPIDIDAILLMPDNLNHSPAGWKGISQFAAKHNLPIGGSFPYTVKDGALFGNANDLFKVGELAAPLADKTLHGEPAGKIMVVTPPQDIWINYTVAKDLGLIVPEGLLSRAAQIIH